MSPLWRDVVDCAVVVVLGLVAVFPGAWAVRGTFRLVDRRARVLPGDRPATARETDHTVARKSVVAAGAHLRGGAWIGMLERLSIFAGLVAHYPEAIAIVLAVKGLARYPELQATDTAAAERFIIGTFVSVLVACGLAGLAMWLVGVL